MYKPNITKKSSSHYKQGQFKPKHKDKYIGDADNIIYRSKWERDFMLWCDKNPNVIRYASEELVIPYINPLDGKQHRYYVDFYVEIMQPDGSIRKCAIEIKPYAQTIPPKVATKTKKSILESQFTYSKSMQTYITNRAKWLAAKNFCQNHGLFFQVITERELYKNNER